jgi:histidine triad (HIT) family protein
MFDKCIFCKIVKGSIPSEIVHETEKILVFKDITPVAPVHYLIIPKKHITSINEIQKEDSEILAEIFYVAKYLGETTPMLENNYRLVCSTGADAGQVVDHMHFHLIGGRKLTWPPG